VIFVCVAVFTQIYFCGQSASPNTAESSFCLAGEISIETKKEIPTLDE